ncbi:hypothetical protein FOMPIDRAFT_1052772 [Fomitopsis schrenkii]|uniref:Uncharacterized protein n=1 Tax=Fomitopsis schrenkii TaxID=2126942 RepID=S8E0Z1_FOMSC|nr:hypothetical protein FOMPIDRAFT_1052772 [Fomitopsis schrenkii]
MSSDTSHRREPPHHPPRKWRRVSIAAQQDLRVRSVGGRRPTSIASTPGAPTARAIAETMASKPTPNGVPMPTRPMTPPPPSEPRTSVKREADVMSVTSVESGAAVGQQSPEGSVKRRSRVLSLKRPTSILRRQGSDASVSSGSKNHSDPLPINPSYVPSQLDEARASLRSKESEVAVLEHDRDNMRREPEEAREEMKSLQEAIEEKREELGSLEEVHTALAIREELKQAKEAASVQDELVGFLQNRVAEIELGAEAERHAKQSWDERAAASEAECASLKADRARLQTEISKEKEFGELQTRQTQLLARGADLGARGREHAAKVVELEAALMEARSAQASAEASLHAALERVAALQEERAQSAAQEEVMKDIEEKRRELLARLQTAQNGSAQAVPAPRTPGGRGRARGHHYGLDSARKVYALLCGRFVASSMQCASMHSQFHGTSLMF